MRGDIMELHVTHLKREVVVGQHFHIRMSDVFFGGLFALNHLLKFIKLGQPTKLSKGNEGERDGFGW